MSTEPISTEDDSRQTTFFQLIGGIEVVRSLVERFYDIMETDPKAAGIRALHPVELAGSREKLFLYLTGWTGGPQLYIERYGHPRLRARHMLFAIGESELDQWMYCMVSAMQDIGIADDVMLKLAQTLWDLADFMRNRSTENL